MILSRKTVRKLRRLGRYVTVEGWMLFIVVALAAYIALSVLADGGRL